MIDPTDDLSIKFDSLNAMAAQRDWSVCSHAHPTRYLETLRIEKLEAQLRGELRTSAIRATVRLRPEPDDRRAWVQIDACFQTGSYQIAYFDEKGDMTDSISGNVAFHKQYLERRDARQALGTGFEMLVLGCLVRVLREGGHSGDGERLADMRKVMRGELPEGSDTADAPYFPLSFQLDL